MTEPTTTERRALVLGGGGVAGIAWEFGLLAGLQAHGIDLADADVVVGTSAGSVVGTTLLQGGAAAAYRGQSTPVEMDDSAMSGFDVSELMAVFAEAAQIPGDPQAARARIGAYARAVPQDAMPQEQRIAMVSSQLPSQDWPAADLRVTAVDATDGSFVVYDKTSGVALAEAIMASCSVPGVGPATLIDGEPFMDGGMRSGTNADVAQDCQRVLVIACNVEPAESALGPTLPQAVAELREHAQVLVVEADTDAVTAFGTNPLLMSTRVPASEAGYRQAATIADQVRAFWA